MNRDFVPKLYRRNRSGEDILVCPYQHLLDLIINAIMQNEREVFQGLNLPFDRMEQCVIDLIQVREVEILISCGWNLNQPSGYDVLTMLLKMCPKFDSS
jgi:hypothetical protein